MYLYIKIFLISYYVLCYVVNCCGYGTIQNKHYYLTSQIVFLVHSV